MDEEAYDTLEEYCGVRCCKITEERGNEPEDTHENILPSETRPSGRACEGRDWDGLGRSKIGDRSELE